MILLNILSAYRENEAYLDSIQGRIDIFMNSLQTFWMNLIGSDIAKWVVDQGTKIIQFLDTAHGKVTAVLTAFGVFLKATKKIDIFKEGLNAALGTNFKKSTIGKVIDMAASGATSAKTFMSAFSKNINKTPTGLGISKAIAENIKDVNTKINMRDAVASALGVTNLSEIGELTEAQQEQAASALEAAAASNNLGEAQKMTTMATAGLTSVSGMAKSAINGLKAACVAHPFIAIATAVMVAVAAIDKFTITAQEASEASHDKFNEIANVVDTTKSNISSLESELSTINSQISELDGKNLSFTDAQELERLKAQRTSLENNLSIQEQLLKSQEKVKNEAAVTAMKDFVKASNEGAESAEKTGKAIGALAGGLAAIGVLASPLTGGLSLGVSAAIVGGSAIVGASAGSVVGSSMNAATIGTYEDWYKTYTDAYKEKSKAAADARQKYEKDPGNMDKYDEWQKLEQEAVDVQSKMYDNLTQMQNYYSELEYGQSKALDKELDTWYNFLDKMNIDQNGAGAKVNALDRIFGENASNEVKAFKKEIDKVIKDKDNKFDIAAEIEGRDDLQELENQLNEIGITTDEVSDYFRQTGEIGAKAFSDLSGEISGAKTAITNLQNALNKNTNEGYETRNTGLEEMKDLMEKGAIGSESNLWNIAEAMGFTYDSAKSIEANADALYKYIKVRDDWYQVDEDGEWGTAGADAFAKDIEKAIKNSKKLQKMDIKWDFDESTGTLDFDFNNMQFDEIVAALGRTKEAAGLTNEEFIDMLTHLGQFYDVQWTSGNDVASYLKYLGTTSLSVKEQLDAVQEPLEQLLSKQGLEPDKIKAYLTGDGSLKKLPEDLQTAVAAYRKLRDEVEKPIETKDIVKATEAKTEEKGGIISKIKKIFTGDEKVEQQVDVEVKADEVDTTKVQEQTKDAITNSKIDAAPQVDKTVELEGKIEDVVETLQSIEDKDITIDVKVKGLDDVEKLNKNLDLDSKVEGNVDKVSEYAKSAKILSGLDDNITTEVIANIGGNVIDEFEFKLNNLETFAEGAKALKGVGSFESSITANIYGNVVDTFEFKINNLKTFADSAKGLENIGIVKSEVTANVNGNVFDTFEYKIDNLKTFSDSAKDISNIGEDTKAKVTANIEGDVIDTFEYKIDNLKRFSDSAKDISSIGEDVKAKVTAEIDGDVIDTFEYKIDNLKKFSDSAKDISNIGEDVKAKVTAEVDGDVIDTFEYKIDNLKKFTDSAKDIGNIGEDVKAKVTAEVDGDVIDTFEYKIDNLKKFSDSAKDISSIGEDTKAKVTAEVDGDVIDTFEYKIDNLKKFTDSAKDISGIGEDVKAKVTANVDGDVIDTFEYKIDNLKKFTDSAKDISSIGEDVKAKITANVDGDVIDTFEYKIDNLKKFSDSAKDISSIGEDVKAKVTANVDGDVLDTFEYKIDNLKKFTDSAKDVSSIGEDVKAKVTAEVDGDVLDTFEYKIDNLKTFTDSAKDVSKIGENVKAKVTAEVDGSVIKTPEKMIDNLKTFSDSAKDVSSIGEDVKAKVTAEVGGSVITTSKEQISNLKTFSDSAKDISNVGKNIEASVKADIYGNVLDDDDKISKLKRFESIASTLASIPKVVISVSAKVATKAINSALSLLQKVKDSGLFKNYKASVAVKAKVDSTEVDSYQPDEKTGTAKYEVDSSKVDSWDPPLKEGTIKYAPSIDPLTYKQTHKTGTITYTPKIKGDGPVVNGTAHVKGTAFAGGTAFKQGDWRTKKDVTALTGELGQELVVPPSGDRWYTVGDNGAEFAHIPKGSIVFNHKQTEELFKNGKVTSGGGRGKVFANGTAYAEGTAYAKGKSKRKTYTFSYDSKNNSVSKKSTTKNASKKSTKDYSSDFEEVFDWFEVRIEEINEDLDLMAAKLENAITIQGKNNILNDMIKTNKSELKTLEKGYKLYNNYANNLLKKVPKKFRDEAKNGKIAIQEFAGKVDEQALEAIKNYREWAQKAADVKKQIQEIKHTITELAKQKFDNISEKYDNIISRSDNRQQHYTDMADLRDNKGKINSGKYYEVAIDEEKIQKEKLKNKKKKLQASLNASVKKGNIKKYSPEWHEMVTEIHNVDAEIDKCVANIEDYQNKINEIKFDQFEKGIYRISRLADETQNIIDLMAEKDVVKTNDNGDVEFTAEGITQMGLYAQNMENYKQQSELYAKEIDELNKMYNNGDMSFTEYLEKLDDLKDKQYGAIKAYNDSKDAIVDLQKARVDEIKNGIDKQIEAYQELIDKKKEELSSEKDLYDFQQSIQESSKNIADLQRQLAALAGDNSASARAQRKKLEAELAKSQKELQDEYYDRSVEKQQEALDNELEQFTELREKEKEGLDKWLENVDDVFKESVKLVQNSGETIKNTIAKVAEDWDLQINTHIKTPWENASTALETTSKDLDEITLKFEKVLKDIDAWADKQINKQKQDNADITVEKEDRFAAGAKVSAKKGTTAYNSKGNKMFNLGYDSTYTVVSVDNKTGMTKVKNSKGEIRYFKTDQLKSGKASPTGGAKTYPYGKASATSGNIKYGDKGTAVKAIQWALKKLKYDIGKSGVDGSFGPATQAAVKKFQKNMGIRADGIVGSNTRAKFKLKGYATGTDEIKKDQLALLHELGDELVLHAGKNGKLEYLSKGSGVLTSDMTERLMNLAMNPQDMLDRNKPDIKVSPEVNNVEMNLNIQYGDILRIENFNGDDPDQIAKIVAKQFEKHTKELNNSLRRFVR